MSTHETSHISPDIDKSFFNLFDSLLEGVQIIDFNWCFVYVNQALRSEINLPGNRLVGQKLAGVFPGIEGTALFDKLKLSMESRQPMQFENEFQYPDNHKRWYKVKVEPVKEGLLVLSLDITAYKEAGEKAGKIRRLYSFISQVNQNIVRVRDEASLFLNSCLIALEFGKFKAAWIGMFDPAACMINLVEQCGLDNEDVRRFSNAPYDGKGPQAYILRTGSHYICNDIENGLDIDGYKPFAAKHGVKSFLVLPIRKQGKVIGSFNLYSTELNFSDIEEIPLLLEIAADISFALDMLEGAKKQVEAEALVISKEKRFRGLIENSADMISLSGADGRLLYASPSVLKQFGYSMAYVPHSVVSDFIHPEDVRPFMVKRQVLLQNPGKSIYHQYRLRHKDGSWVWVEATVTNMLDEPSISALVSNFRDISEKKAIESQLEFDRINLNALINNTRHLMWSVDRNLNLITSNQQFDEVIKNLTGITIPKGGSIAGNFPKDDVDRYKKMYERAFSGEAFSEIEYGTFPHEYWAETSYNPIRSGNEVIGTACQTRDITKKKKAEIELKNSERFNRALFRSLTAQIAVVNNKGEIIAVNEAWGNFAIGHGDPVCGLLGKGANYFDACGQTAIYSATVGAEVLKGVKDVMDQEISLFYREFPSDLPGHQRWFALQIVKFDGAEPMVVVTHQDISERKHAEERLVSKNAELQNTNAELDRFVYSISHDLRSPLASILGLIGFIEQESEEENTLLHAAMVRTAINRLDGFIRNILSYSHNNRAEPGTEPVPLNQTVLDIIDSLRGLKDVRDIDFEVRIDEGIPFCSDIQRLKTVMENLISNAIKYHRHDGTVKFIKVTGQSHKDRLRLSVIDNGIGIKPEYHNKIFDMFYSLPGKQAGSGIGLYIVKETVEKLEGTIAVESEKGEGSTFIIDIKNYAHDYSTDTNI